MTGIYSILTLCGVYLVAKIILNFSITLPDCLLLVLGIVLFIRQYLAHRNEQNKLIVSHKSELEYITKITETLRSTLELDKILKITLTTLATKLGHRKVFLYLIEQLGDKEYLKCIGFPEAISIDGVSNLNIYLNADELFNRKRSGIEAIQKTLKLTEFGIVPVTLRGKSIGMIIFGSNPLKTDQDAIEIFANQVGMAIENAWLYEKTKELSIIDELTKVYNRRYFQQRLTEELNLAKRYNSSLSLAMIDIDDFKYYNDTNGHLLGDKCLSEVANLLLKNTFAVDVVARYGGEEFVVILPGTYGDDAILAGEKFCSVVRNHEFPYGEKQPLGRVTISVGLATYPNDAEDANSLISCADKALYEAKRTGKNKVCKYGQSSCDRC